MVYKNPGPLKFVATIKRNNEVDNSSAYVSFPYDLKETFGIGDLVSFKATFDSRVAYSGSLAKMGGPDAMLLLRKDIRAQLGKEPGDSVEVMLELDDGHREVALSEDVVAALNSKNILELLEKLAYTQRKEYIFWVESAKKLDTRQNRIQKMCEMISAKNSK